MQESIKAIVVENEASMEELEGKEAERKEVEQKMKAAKKELAVFQREQTLSNKKVAGLEKELSKQQPQEDALKESVRRLAKRAERNAKEEAKLKNDLAAQQSLLEELRRSLEEVQSAKADFEKSAKDAADGEVQLSADQVQEYHQRKEQAGGQTAKLQSKLRHVTC